LAVVLILVTILVDVDPARSHSPHDDVADVAVSPTYAEDETVFAIVRGKFLRSTDGGSTWAQMVRGLGNDSQVLARLGVAPSNEQILYVTTRGDGVLKSEDGGVSWRSASHGLGNLHLEEVAVSPTSPNVVVAAGGPLGGGLFRTSDGGASWSKVEGFGHVTSLAFLADGSRLLAGDARGRIATSDDAGRTWGPASTLDQEAISAIATGGEDDATATVFAAGASGRLFRSNDGGRSFASLGHDLPHERVQSLLISPDYAEDTTLWASTWHSGVFRSTNGGKTWEPASQGLTTDPQADEFDLPQFRALATGVDSSGELSLIVGAFDGIFRYDERSGKWNPVETLTDYVAGLAVSPEFGNDRTIAVTSYVKGAFVSEDGGDSWQFANRGLVLDDVGAGNEFAPLWRLHNVVISPNFANDGTIFSANGVRIVKSTDGGGSWKQIEVSAPPPGETLRQFVLAVSTSYASDQTVFAATRQGEIFRSEGAGEPGTWTRVGGFKAGERVRSLVVSPDYVNDHVLYAGTVAGVYISTDGGVTWDATGPQEASQLHGHEAAPGVQVAISPTYGADSTAFAGTNSGLFVTRDAGRSWTEVTAAPLAASSTIEAVAVSPGYKRDRTILVSTRELGLVRSSDAGASFHRVGTELFDANRIVADFSNPTSAPIQFSPTFATDKTIFAYAQTDVVRSTDGGQSWELLRLPSAGDVLESLGFAPGASGEAPDNGRQRWWFETPIGNLSARRVLAAATAGLVAFAALWALGVGGRGSGRAFALHLGSSILVVAVALVVLAA
jgi:photosystem II stability/assembly factor-like uncharacterized protein